jgi:hypothetical protein
VGGLAAALRLGWLIFQHAHNQVAVGLAYLHLVYFVFK